MVEEGVASVVARVGVHSFVVQCLPFNLEPISSVHTSWSWPLLALLIIIVSCLICSKSRLCLQLVSRSIS